jgi:hypothetical protein
MIQHVSNAAKPWTGPLPHCDTCNGNGKPVLGLDRVWRVPVHAYGRGGRSICPGSLREVTPS